MAIELILWLFSLIVNLTQAVITHSSCEGNIHNVELVQIEGCNGLTCFLGRDEDYKLEANFISPYEVQTLCLEVGFKVDDEWVILESNSSKNQNISLAEQNDTTTCDICENSNCQNDNNVDLNPGKFYTVSTNLNFPESFKPITSKLKVIMTSPEYIDPILCFIMQITLR